MRHSVSQTVCAAMLVVGACALTGCGPSVVTLNQFAGQGGIDDAAPVLAHVSIDISAPPAKVWSLLVNAPDWPKWNKNISQVSTAQPLAPGARFLWKTGSSTIHSQVQFFETERRLGWTGTALTAKAVHQWRLIPVAGGQTRVTIDESMDGPLMALLFPSAKVAEAGKAWLTALKQAAEKP